MSRKRRDFPGDEDATKAIAKQILDYREMLGFMTVARAMVASAAAEEPRRDTVVAEALGISRQTHYNWLHDGLSEWLEGWRKRLDAIKEKRPAETENRKDKRLTEADFEWIARILRNAPSSWGARQEAVARAAGADPRRSWLRKLSRVTLWRNRKKIWQFMEAERTSLQQRSPINPPTERC